MSEVGGGHVVVSMPRGRPWPVVWGVWGPATGPGQVCVRDEAVRFGCGRSGGLRRASGSSGRVGGDQLEVCLVVKGREEGSDLRRWE